MRSPLLAPVLANIFKIESEGTIIKTLFNNRKEVLLSLRCWYSAINKTRGYTISTRFV